MTEWVRQSIEALRQFVGRKLSDVSYHVYDDGDDYVRFTFEGGDYVEYHTLRLPKTCMGGRA